MKMYFYSKKQKFTVINVDQGFCFLKQFSHHPRPGLAGCWLQFLHIWAWVGDRAGNVAIDAGGGPDFAA